MFSPKQINIQINLINNYFNNKMFKFLINNFLQNKLINNKPLLHHSHNKNS